MSEAEVFDELKKAGMNKAKLMQAYSDEMQALVKLHGGNVSDVPLSKDHPYHKLQHKLMILHRLQV